MVAVTTNVGGLPYVFTDGEAGYQVNRGDGEAAAARIVELVRSPAKLARMSAAALGIVARHRWKRLRVPWLALLERAAAARRGRAS